MGRAVAVVYVIFTCNYKWAESHDNGPSKFNIITCYYHITVENVITKSANTCRRDRFRERQNKKPYEQSLPSSSSFLGTLSLFTFLLLRFSFFAELTSMSCIAG